MPIPKIIHQTWKTKDIPYQYYNKRWIESWKSLNPDWEYRFWTDEDLRNLIKNKYEWFLDIYDSYPYNICRADASRYFILNEYGGLYVDLDFECLKSFDPLVENSLVLGTIEKTDFVMREGYALVPNALMMSIPNHAFWKFALDNLKKQFLYAKEKRPELLATAHKKVNMTLVSYLTGCDFLSNLYKYYRILYKSNSGIYPEITLYPYQYFYPLNCFYFMKHGRKEIGEKPYNNITDSYAITYWVGIWLKKGQSVT